MGVETNSTEMRPHRRLLRLLRDYKKEIRYILLYAIVAGFINLSLPLGVQAIIGLIAGGSISASWGVLVFFVLFGALMAGLLRLAQLTIMEYAQRRLFTEASFDFALRIPRLDMELLRNEHLPDLVNRFFDTITLQKGLPKLLIDGATASLTIIFSLTLLSFYHPTFVVVSIVLLILLMALLYFTGPLGLKSSMTESKYKYKLAYWLEEVGRAAGTFKLAGDSRFPIRRADELTNQYLEARARHWRVYIVQFLAGATFKVLVLGSYLVLGSLLVMNNELNIGQFVASELLVLFIVDSVEKLVLLYETGYDVLTAIEKLGQVTDLPLEPQDGVKITEINPDKALSVELRRFNYTFPDAQTPVLSDLNIQINAGERVAIMGYDRSGKSTLLQIFSMLKIRFEGGLFVDGLPLQNLDLRNLRGRVGDVSFLEDIFKGTILENITLDRNVDLATVLRIIEGIGLTEYVQSAPNGLQTELLPGGRNTPGSVVAKILIARAICERPGLLVLEDVFPRFVLQDRLLISRYLTDRQRPWTLVCVTDDPEVAPLFDRVLVLKEGRVVFDGPIDQFKNTRHFDLVCKPVPEGSAD